MTDLDDPARFGGADPSGFLESVERLPGQVREAWRLGREAFLPPAGKVGAVLVCGMGGSGIAGDVCRAILAPTSPAPILTLKSYDLPAWVGRDTLVFAVSYSGTTEETLAAFDAAAARGARLVAVTTGGALLTRAQAGGHPSIVIPGGLQPRAALAYLALPVLVACARLGLGPRLAGEVAETLQVLEARVARCERGVPAAKNPAKTLALRLRGLPVVVAGGDGLGSVAAYRWKCQLNEVAKVPAFSSAFPELGHNEVVGWEDPGGVTGDFALVVLRHAGEPPRLAGQIEAALGIVGPAFAVAEQVSAKGGSPLARLFDLVSLGDFTTTYLALATGVDPTPVATIDRLKRAT